MMLHPLFVADVLEGFEGTLDEVVGRVENPELNAQLDALRSHVAKLRIRIEEPPETGGSRPDCFGGRSVDRRWDECDSDAQSRSALPQLGASPEFQ